MKRNQKIDSYHRFLSFFYGLPSAGRVKLLPEYSGDVDAHIRMNAKRDLPSAQFEGRENGNSGLQDRLEITGTLGFNGELFEIGYQAQNLEGLDELLDDSKMQGIEAFSSCEIMIKHEEANRACELVHFHSHPYGNTFGRGDLLNIKNLLRAFREKKQYFLLYSPFEDRVDWYEFKV